MRLEWMMRSNLRFEFGSGVSSIYFNDKNFITFETNIFVMLWTKGNKICRDTKSFIQLKTFHFEFYIMQWFILHSRIWQEELSFVTPWYYTFEMSLDFYTRSSSYIPSHSIIGKPFMRKLSKTIFGEQYLKISTYIHAFDVFPYDSLFATIPI